MGQALRVSSTAAVQFATYEGVRQRLGNPNDPGVICASALSAGVVSGSVITPLDAILTRVYNGEHTRGLHYAFKALTNEGAWRGLCRGLGHNVLRTTVHGSIP